MKHLLIILLSLPIILSAQSYKEDLSAVINHMAGLQSYSMRVYQRLFLDGDFKNVFQEKSVVMKKSIAGSYFKHEDGTEFISNSRFQIYLDRTTREIIAKRRVPGEIDKDERTASSVIKSLDSLLSYYKSVRLVKYEKSTAVYELEMKGNMAIKKVVVYIDREKKIVSKVQYWYRDAMKIIEKKNTKHTTTFEISYVYEGPLSSLNEALLDEANYLAIKNDRIKLLPKYKDYTLHLLD